ncbi:hypothetical protein M1M10_19605, partial [Pseudomonas umsongensis]
QHFHADHPVFSCSKIEQKQLNTWVSFQSAEQPLLGQFSVSGNNASDNARLRGNDCCRSWLRRLYRGHLANMIIGEPTTNTTLVNDDVKRPGKNQIQVIV